jgi:hypothetical protein
MRVLHIAPVDIVAQNHVLPLLPALRKLGIKTELLVIFGAHPPSPVVMAGMKRGGVPMYGLKLAHIDDIHHPTTPQTILKVTEFIQSRHADIVHTHLAPADFFGGFGARWGHVEHRVSTRYDADEDRSGEHWQSVAELFGKHIALSDTIADTIRADGVTSDKIERVNDADGYARVYQEVLKEGQ